MSKNLNQNEIRNHIEKACAQNGYELLKFKRYSNHTEDYYLFTVLAVRDTSYVTWLFNSSVGGLNNGHYGLNKDSAEKDYESREYRIRIDK